MGTTRCRESHVDIGSIDAFENALKVVENDLRKTWLKEMIIEKDAALRSSHDTKGSFIGDYSYPSILLTKDGKVHIAYTYLRDYIKHVTLEM